MTSSTPAVLMVTGAYFPELSGAGLQCRELVRQLGDAVSCTILTTTADPLLPTEDERDGVRVHRVFVNPRSVWSKCVAGLRMTRFVIGARRRFSILHLHGFSQKTMLLVVLGILLRKRIGIKLTSVGHDDPAAMRRRGRVAYWCYSRADLLFGVSARFQTLYAASGLPVDRFRLIPNGVDLGRFTPASLTERRALRAELGLPRELTLILFVGFFSREKCPDVLLDAWLRLPPNDQAQSALLFVGATRSDYYEVDASLAEGMRARASQAGRSTHVLFVESTVEIEKYHRAADLFVLPSMREGLPNALLEAMACGLGCIASRLEGVTDGLIADGESGVLVPPGDVAALERAISLLLADPGRVATMGAEARRTVERDFSLTETAAAYLAAYQEMLAS